MFYDKQPKQQQEDYKKMLELVGSLSRLFSEAKEPFLHYRAHENIFAKYFDVENNARSDDSADAFNSKKGIGIGLKTWMGGNDQKVAEFGKLRPQYEHLSGRDLVEKIAEYRNIRIRTTMNIHGLREMLYHVVKRVPGAMCIYESAFDPIDIPNIKIDEKRGNDNNIYFSDGKHTYHFSISKHTLYMIFDDMELLDQFDVFIHEDPYDILEEALCKVGKIVQLHKDDDFEWKVAEGVVDGYTSKPQRKKDTLCLRLYSTKADGTKVVFEKSGLNQWNAGGRKRDPDEVYIPYPSEDRKRKDFFPPRDTPFDLTLPDGTEISAKVCQDNSKAIMSNPNKVLGKWLLRDVFELPEGTPVTYSMLREYDVDSVMFTKESEGHYSVDFCRLGTYEKTYGLKDIEEDDENDNAPE